MLFFGKVSGERAPILKALSGFLFCIIAIVFGIIFGSKSIQAQIENLYRDQNDQVAGISSLMSAVAGNDIEGIKFFSKAGSAILNQKNSGGATALHVACREKNLEAVKILLENQAEINISDNEGWTPLMRASLAGDAEIVKLLLEKNAEANNLNSIKESAIIHATSSDCFECLNIMLEKFNFIKLMNFELLKDQLSSAYKISQNHDKQDIQNLLSSYLDRAIKMSSLIETDEKISEGFKDENESENKDKKTDKITSAPIFSDGGNKRFKFISSQSLEQKEIKKVQQIDKISILKKDIPSITEPRKADQSNRKKVYKFLGNKFSAENLLAESFKQETSQEISGTKIFKLKKSQESDLEERNKILKKSESAKSESLNFHKEFGDKLQKKVYKLKSAN